MLGEYSPHGPCFLATKVQRSVLLFPVQLSQVFPLFVVDHSQHSGYRLANHLTVVGGKHQDVNWAESCSRTSNKEEGLLELMIYKMN